jgi:hypothetical protein
VTLTVAITVTERILFAKAGGITDQLYTRSGGLSSMSVAAYSLSVATNATSTGLIAYKTW